jgi:hypothetical protein
MLWNRLLKFETLDRRELLSVSPTEPTTPTPASTAGGPIDLSVWTLTLPTGPTGEPDTVDTADLIAGYSSANFQTESNGSLQLWTPVTGVHDSNYPRTELRENQSWQLADGTATLAATLNVGQVPSDGEVIVSQVRSTSESFLKIVYDDGKLEAQIQKKSTDSSSSNYTLAKNIALGQELNYTVTLSPSGELVIDVNGKEELDKSIDKSWDSEDLYFKAGDYLQDNKGPSSEGGLVTFEDLAITHQDATSGGSSGGSGSTGGGTTGGGTTGGGTTQGQGPIDLSDWNLTLPSGPQGDPTVVSTSQLVAGYSSAYFSQDSTGLHFFAPVTGVHTANSSYPRSELRETHPDGSLYNWHVGDDNASLTATLAVTQIPSTGKVIVGQIHGVENGEPLVKLQYDNGKLEALIRNKPDDSSSPSTTLATGIALGQSFSYAINVSESGVMSIYINGTLALTDPLDPSWDSIGLYYKAGAYVQDNSGPSTEGAAVTFTALSVTHTK